MRAVILKSIVKFHIVILNDEGKAIAETETQPINIYRGQEFNYEQFITEVEESALQRFKARGSGTNK